MSAGASVLHADVHFCVCSGLMQMCKRALPQDTWRTCAGIHVAADIVLRREATPQDASSFLSEVFTQTGHQLDAFQSLCTLAEGIATGQGAAEHLQCRVHAKHRTRKPFVCAHTGKHHQYQWSEIA